MVCGAVQGLQSAVQLQLLLANAAAARALLVQHNLRLVISIAKRHANRGVDIADLVQDVRPQVYVCLSGPCAKGMPWWIMDGQLHEFAEAVYLCAGSRGELGRICWLQALQSRGGW